jgi:hypothetical protein
MDSKHLNVSWSETYILDQNENVSGDYAGWEKLTKETVGQRTAAFAHSCLVRKDEFFNSGIMEFENTWSPVFEDLYALYMHKIGNGEKAHGSKFYWRNHSMNMTNSMFADPQWKPLMEEQRLVADYTNDAVNADLRNVHSNMQNLIQTLR